MASKVELVYTVLEVLIAVACCLGNLLVIWAVWKCGAMRRQPTFCFIVSLAVADFLVGAVAIPVAVLVNGWVRTSVHGCVVLCSLVIVLTQASVHSLLAIALDRFLRVYIPLRYRKLVTAKRSWGVVGGCWITACLLGSVPLLGWSLHTSQNTTINSTHPPTCKFMDVMSMSYMVFFNFLGCILLPMLCTAALYAYIFHLIRRRLQSWNGESSAFYQRERSLACSLLFVLVLFALCWLPIHLINIAIYANKDVHETVLYTGILLSHANSAVNPVVYTFKVPRIKKAYRDICMPSWLVADREHH
ncbi:adenosine receptor A3-like [Alosa alosa]|uniref:adenosine receptor A3-like n=1 Tax=Alosa alosa TaxID=278164 RepID=UPI0020150C41|nr:adenosine receptor A3-like [Alosa alosa]